MSRRLTPLQRILCHTLLTVVFLATLGWFLVQLAALAWNPYSLPPSAVAAEDPLPQEDMIATLQWQLPLRLAVLGAVLVLIGEGLLIVLRRSLSHSATPQKSSSSNGIVSSACSSTESSAGSSTFSHPS